MFNLKIILASTRPGRKGLAIASWINDLAGKKSTFSTELLDLAEINLPFLDEPEHPRFKEYTHDHTRKWSKVIESADAFIIVTAEYNYGYPAPLKNALDFLSQEWAYKPLGFVSYGGVAAGTRAVQQLKQVVTALNMMPVPAAVHIPFFTKYIGADGKFNPDENLIKSAGKMLAELEKWTKALIVLRQ
jgi:NAD(P)H-dependent FMN reductase